MKVVAECLATTQSEETQQCAQQTLHQLAIVCLGKLARCLLFLFLSSSFLYISLSLCRCVGLFLSLFLSFLHCQGNPRYQSQVYKSLIKLLSAASPEAQRLSAYTIRLIQVSPVVLHGPSFDVATAGFF